MSSSVWPLFDLSITTPRLVLRTPRDEDLFALADCAAAGVHNPMFMPFTQPWTDNEPGGALERGLLQYHWDCRATWKPSAWKQSFGVFLDGKIIGVQDLMANDFAITRTAQTGSWLGLEFQGRGIGKEMRVAVLNFAFQELDAVRAETGALVGNASSLGVTKSLGYKPDGTTIHVVRDTRVEQHRFSMDRQHWESNVRDLFETKVTGFEACRPLFGV